MGSPFSTYSPPVSVFPKILPFRFSVRSCPLTGLSWNYILLPVNLMIPSFDRKLRIASIACFDEEGAMVSVVVVYKENAFTPHICQL